MERFDRIVSSASGEKIYTVAGRKYRSCFVEKNLIAVSRDVSPAVISRRLPVPGYSRLHPFYKDAGVREHWIETISVSRRPTSEDRHIRHPFFQDPDRWSFSEWRSTSLHFCQPALRLIHAPEGAYGRKLTLCDGFKHACHAEQHLPNRDYGTPTEPDP